MLAALNMFISAFWNPIPPSDYAKSEDARAQAIGRIFAITVRPVVAYYVIRWMVQP